MTESKKVRHTPTPGPWRIEEADVIPETGEFHEATIWADGDGTDAHPDVHVAIVRIGLAGSEANARLIAAAPDLLSALEAVLEDTLAPVNTLAMQRARAAINKAKGLNA